MEPIIAQSYVKITEDSMQAYLYLVPRVDGELYTRDELKRFLSTQGVSAGYHDSNLAAMAKKKIYGREVLVAAGTEPTGGRDGYYEYQVEMEDYSKHPRVREDGSVDYQSMSLLQNVEKGQVLAIYHHAVMGKNGMDVKGEVLEAAKNKDLPMIKGLGIEQSAENPDVYVAKNAGKVRVRDDKLEICNVHEIHGDVDMITGKVEFYGDVVIDGNVAAGVVIRAGKTLTINGTVEAVKIYAGGDVILKRGVQGNEKAHIRTKGNLYADFLEHCTVETEGDVHANYILNSTVSADGRVIATGRKGMILGGYVHGFNCVDAMIIGSESSVRTVVHAGCTPEMYAEKQETRKQEQALVEEMRELEADLQQAVRERAIRRKDPSYAMKVQQLMIEKSKLIEKAERLKEKKSKELQLMDDSRLSEICAQEKIYAGTVISINNAQLTIPKSTGFMKYSDAAGLIEGKVIRI